MVNGCFSFLREFVYVVLLGDEFSVDFLENRETTNQKMKTIRKLSIAEEGLHLLTKQN